MTQARTRPFRSGLLRSTIQRRRTCLLSAPGPLILSLTLGIHVLGQAADIRFVHFNRAAQETVAVIGNRLADTMQHEPSRFLRHANGAG